MPVSRMLSLNDIVCTYKTTKPVPPEIFEFTNTIRDMPFRCPIIPSCPVPSITRIIFGWELVITSIIIYPVVSGLLDRTGRNIAQTRSLHIMLIPVVTTVKVVLRRICQRPTILVAVCPVAEDRADDEVISAEPTPFGSIACKLIGTR